MIYHKAYIGIFMDNCSQSAATNVSIEILNVAINSAYGEVGQSKQTVRNHNSRWKRLLAI
jgi:hypothetical protein